MILRSEITLGGERIPVGKKYLDWESRGRSADTWDRRKNYRTSQKIGHTCSFHGFTCFFVLFFSTYRFIFKDIKTIKTIKEHIAIKQKSVTQ